MANSLSKGDIAIHVLTIAIVDIRTKKHQPRITLSSCYGVQMAPLIWTFHPTQEIQ